MMAADDGSLAQALQDKAWLVRAGLEPLVHPGGGARPGAVGVCPEARSGAAGV